MIPILNNKIIESQTTFILKCAHGNITNQEIKYFNWLLGVVGVLLVIGEYVVNQKRYL